MFAHHELLLIVAYSYAASGTGDECGLGQWQCESGGCVAAVSVCDGEFHCDDGSDEALTRCGRSGRPLFGLILHCSQTWSPNYDTVCPESCRRWPQFCYYALAGEHGVPGVCRLPAFPRIGTFTIEDIVPRAGDAPADFSLVYSCPRGHKLKGGNPRCVSGTWLGDIPTCRRECGKVTPNGMSLRRRRHVTANRGELPWHAGIYSKRYTPYSQICGGSLVSTTVVISAAHCFWGDVEKLLPAKDFAVGVGKIYRLWSYNEYGHGQKSDVRGIKIPPRFSGAASHFQDDISLVFLATPVKFTLWVCPACLDFNVLFDERQLQPGNIGKVGGWGLTSEDGDPSRILKVLELPYVDVEKCIADLPMDFRSYITSDKICAGTKKGTALCKGDSGGGLAFPEEEHGVQRWYLRGLVSAAPSNEHKCNSDTYTSFTQLQKHEGFVSKHINLDAE